MTNPARSTAHTQVSVLRGLMRKRASIERCELCGTQVPSRHQHLVDPTNRKLACACEACAILFSHRVGAKYLRVPRDARPLPNFEMTDADWSALRLPIDIAFFLHGSVQDRVIAFYPSPAGPTESLLSLDSWNDIVAKNPELTSMQPDVEALLVNRRENSRRYYIAPIDKCYELVGLIRTRWHGLSGGDEVWTAIETFFSCLS